MFKLMLIVINLAVTPPAKVGIFQLTQTFESAAACEQFRADNGDELVSQVKDSAAEFGFDNVEINASCQADT